VEDQFGNFMTRYLIMTADKRTWTTDKKIIFLGHWCNEYDSKQYFKNIDCIYAKPYGVSITNKKEDRKNLNQYKALISKKVFNLLNRHHNLNLKDRSWEIIMGHWLERFISASINRYKSLINCLDNYDVSEVAITNDSFLKFVPKNSNESLNFFNDPQFNQYLFSDILSKQKKGIKFNIKFLKVNKNFKENIKFKSNKNKQKMKLGLSIRYSILKLYHSMIKQNKFFFIGTYLPKATIFFLQLKLGQIPAFFSSTEPNINQIIDKSLRIKLTDNLQDGNTEPIINFICNNLFKFIPSSYLENLSEYSNYNQKYAWPSNPKLIFTSNNFDTDDVFKIWTAFNVYKGSKYIVGQHGNNYGTNQFLAFDTIEERTADRFISWGWTRKPSNIVKGFYFKHNIYKRKASLNLQQILIVTLPMGYQVNTWDDSYLYLEYLKNITNLLKIIDKKKYINALVRLHHHNSNSFFQESNFLIDSFPNLKFDNGRMNIKKLFKSSKLVVHTYDSTGMIETLTANIPTIVLMLDGFKSLNSDAKLKYQKLFDVGIIVFNNKDLIKQIDNVNLNVDIWWSSHKVQSAIINFLKEYAAPSVKPIAFLTSVLKN
jgi:putative transferase (TIGR04331 family)